MREDVPRLHPVVTDQPPTPCTVHEQRNGHDRTTGRIRTGRTIHSYLCLCTLPIISKGYFFLRKMFFFILADFGSFAKENIFAE